MVSIDEDNKTAFTVCIEVVLMKRGDAHYNLILAKLMARYDCGIHECVDCPEYLKAVMKDVYQDKYDDVLDALSLESEKLEDIDEFKDEFFKFMKN